MTRTRLWPAECRYLLRPFRATKYDFGCDPQAYAVGLLSYALSGLGAVNWVVFPSYLAGGKGTHEGCSYPGDSGPGGISHPRWAVVYYPLPAVEPSGNP
jgi:hypothetical protein